MRWQWLLVFAVASAGTVAGGLLFDYASDKGAAPQEPVVQKPEPAPGRAQTVDRPSSSDLARQQLRRLKEMQLARFRSRPAGRTPPPGFEDSGAAGQDSDVDTAPGARRDGAAARDSEAAASRPALRRPAAPSPKSAADQAPDGAKTDDASAPEGAQGQLSPGSVRRARRAQLAGYAPGARASAGAGPDESAAESAQGNEQLGPGEDELDEELDLGASPRPRPEGVPFYEFLHRIREFGSKRMYADVLVPDLHAGVDRAEIKRVAKAIAEFEGIDTMTLYSTVQARQAHYDMGYADAHPEALAGLLGKWERGSFKAYEHSAE